MIRDAGYGGEIASAYSDSSADLPLLRAAKAPVVVNPKVDEIEMFRRVLPAGTPILNWGCARRGGEAVSVASPPSGRPWRSGRAIRPQAARVEIAVNRRFARRRRGA